MMPALLALAQAYHEDLDRPGSPKQKDRRRPAVLSFTVGVDALDFALALDSGRYGSLMSLVGASRCENLSIKPSPYQFRKREEEGQSRFRKSEQGDKWSFCLTAGKIGPRIRRDDEQTTTPEPHTGLQGEGGACCRQGRPDDRATG